MVIEEDEEMRELIYLCAGAATQPLMADNPTYVFPAERVGEAVAECLRSQGYGHLAYLPNRHSWPIRLRQMLLRDGSHLTNRLVRDVTGWLERARWLQS